MAVRRAKPMLQDLLLAQPIQAVVVEQVGPLAASQVVLVARAW